MCTDAVGDAVGLPVNDPHAAVIDAQRVGADLRHRGRKTLPDIGAAGHQFHGSRRIDADACTVGGAQPALVDKDGEPGPDQFAGIAAAAQLGLQIAPADPRQRLVEQQGVVAGIVDEVGPQRAERAAERHLGAADQIAAAYFDPVEA